MVLLTPKGDKTKILRLLVEAIYPAKQIPHLVCTLKTEVTPSNDDVPNPNKHST